MGILGRYDEHTDSVRPLKQPRLWRYDESDDDEPAKRNSWRYNPSSSESGSCPLPNCTLKVLELYRGLLHLSKMCGTIGSTKTIGAVMAMTILRKTALAKDRQKFRLG